jgi:hypothetical protein
MAKRRARELYDFAFKEEAEMPKLAEVEKRMAAELAAVTKKLADHLYV